MATIRGNSGNNNLTGTTGNDFIYGYDGLDTLTGLAGNDRLEAGNGNDSLDGGTGADTMIGGSGDDTYIVDSLSDVVTEVAGGGTDTIKTSISYTLGENHVNNLILTGSSNLNGTGNSYDNVITGNGGNNTLKGNAGNDTLDGGNGIDTLVGGIGDDTYIVNSTTEVIVEVPGEGTDTVISSVTYTLGENYLNNLTLTGLGNLNGTGNTYNNVITDNDGNNFLQGGDGNDSLYGTDGDDTLYGGKGNDSLDSYYNYMKNPDDYPSDQRNILKGGEGNDTLYATIGRDTLYGEQGNDLIIGGGFYYGYAFMYGGDGNDTLSGYGEMYGEGGDDSFTLFEGSAFGGLGNDTITCYDSDLASGSIRFNSANEGTDTIIDFGGFWQTYYIAISASGFGGGLTPGGLGSERFTYGTSASTSNQRFIYDTSTGYLRFDADGNGVMAASVLAIFQGAPDLVSGDIGVF